MTSTDLDVLMGNLNRLIYDKSNTLISGNRLIEEKKAEIKLIYEELGYLIQSIFNDSSTQTERRHELEDVESWKRNLMDVAQDAENIVDRYISSAILSDGGNDLRDCSHNLKNVVENLNSMRKEISHLTPKFQNQNQSSSPQLAGTSSSKTIAKVNPSAPEYEQIIVGFDEDALSIMDRLTGDRKQLDIISIVGMGGLGKTTLATKIFNDPYVAYYFDVRGWITVSEAYATRDLLSALLASIGKSVHEATTEEKLSEILYRSLKGRKYLIVIDDIWSAKAWDNLRLCFPNDYTGSRILLTTRLTEVAWHASSGGLIHNLQYLSEEKSWELFLKKTFRGNECPVSLIRTGKHIVKKCQGLPLALVVIAGVLEKRDKDKDLWEKVAESVSSYIVGDPKGCLDTLALSYEHLPHHLRNCFLYVGGFPEDHEIKVQKLIRLWMAEGFIKENAQRSLEEQAGDYLKDLVDRNLLVVAKRRSDGGIKACRMHDLLRELCLIKAAESKFFKKISIIDCFGNSDSTSGEEKQRRIFGDYNVFGDIYPHYSAIHLRSLLCFSNLQSSMNFYTSFSWVPFFSLLRVLDLVNIQMDDFSYIEWLIHLRYLAVWATDTTVFNFSVGNPRILETLILKGKFEWSNREVATRGMVNLRHLRIESIICWTVLCNLQTMSRLIITHSTSQTTLLKSLPNIKKLACCVTDIGRYDLFHKLTHLQVLDIIKRKNVYLESSPLKLFWFPESLKKLTLQGLKYPWSYMSTIQQLPNLEVLKLLDSSFEGSLWDTCVEQFPKLKFLKLEYLNIHRWVASSFSFPQLRNLEVRTCRNLKGIPLEIGRISTLQHIKIDDSTSAVFMSVNRIQQEQREIGNFDIHVKLVAPSEVFYKGNPYFG